MLIRPYVQEDWPDLCRVHDAARVIELWETVGLAAFLPLAVAAENEGLFDNRIEVLEHNGRVQGFVAFTGDELTWLYVHPDLHGRGFGKALLEHALKLAGPVVQTEVLEGNAGATRFYLANGFTLVSKKTGKLAGNEEFSATGLYLRHERLQAKD